MSTATRPMTDADLQNLLERARLNNALYDVTGLLLYHEGRFMQLIEGPEESVRKLYSYIEQDPRHADAAKLADKRVFSRSFPNWDMAFWPTRPEELAGVSGFVLPDTLQLPEEGLSNADALLLKLMHNHMLRSEA